MASSQGSLPNSDDLTEKREFLWKVHGYVNDYIRFADAKAGFCVGLTSALIGVLYSTRCHELFLKIPFQQWNFWSYLSLSAFISLASSVGLAIHVVRPRLRRHSKRGFVFWEAISQFEDAERYDDAYDTQTRHEMTMNLSHHVYALAKICDCKYRWVLAAMLTGAAGGLLALFVLLFGRH
jgi:hypothetical protein